MNDVLGNSPSTLLDLVERITILEFELKSIRVEQDESKISRRGLHQKLDTMIERNAETAESVKMLVQEVKEMKPTLTLHEQLRHQLRGAFWVVAFVWSTFLLAAGFLIRQLWMWIAGK